MMMLVGVIRNIPGSRSWAVEFAAALAIGGLLLTQSHSMVRLAGETISEMGEYGKLLIPVMTTAMAAQGWTTSAAAIYAGTIGFNYVLTVLISKILIPGVYIYLVLAVASAATDEENVK